MQQSAVLTLTEHFGFLAASSGFFKPIARIFKDIPALQNRHTRSAGQAQSHSGTPQAQDWPEDSRRWWAGRRAEDSDLWAFYRCRCLTPCRWRHSIGPSETQSIMLAYNLINSLWLKVVYYLSWTVVKFICKIFFMVFLSVKFLFKKTICKIGYNFTKKMLVSIFSSSWLYYDIVHILSLYF